MDVPLERKADGGGLLAAGGRARRPQRGGAESVSILAAAGAVGLGFWNVVMGLNPVTLVAMLGLGFVSGVSCAFQY